MNIPNPYTLPAIDFIGGSTQELLFYCYNETFKQPHDMTSCTADFSIINFVNKNGDPLVSKEMKVRLDLAADEDVYNAISVTLDPEDTVEIPAGNYIYQISIRDSSGRVEIPNQGIIHLINNINKGFVKG